MEERRAALEQYLRALCNDAVIASSWEFRQFLCLSDFSKATKSRDLRQNGIENKLLSGLRSAFDPSGNLSRRLLGRSKKKHERRNSLPPMSLVDILTQKLGHALHRDGSGHEGDDMDSEDLMSPVGEDASLRPLPPTIHVERDSKSGSPTEQGMHDRIRAQIEESRMRSGCD